MIKYSATMRHQNGEEFLRENYDLEWLCEEIIEDLGADGLLERAIWHYEYNKEGVEAAASDAGVEITWHDPQVMTMNEGNLLLKVNDTETTSASLHSNMNVLRIEYKMTDKNDAKITEKIAVEITGTQLKIYNSDGILLQAYIDNNQFVPLLKGELFKSGMKSVK